VRVDRCADQSLEEMGPTNWGGRLPTYKIFGSRIQTERLTAGDLNAHFRRVGGLEFVGPQ